MRPYQLIIRILICVMAILIVAHLVSCSTPNVFINGKFETVATTEPFVNKEGLWHETGGRYVAGMATTEMLPDSTYRMQTNEGWIMTVKYDRIFWMDQLATGAAPEEKKPAEKRSVYSVDYGF